MISRLMFTWVPCGSCGGTCGGPGWRVEPWGCWDCRNVGKEPHVRKIFAWSRRLSAIAWKVGPTRCEDFSHD